MGVITAKQLKIKTGEVIKRVKSGERLTITYHGKPVAIILPSEERKKDDLERLRPYDDAWKEIESALAKTEPAFKGWQEATDWVRNRH